MNLPNGFEVHKDIVKRSSGMNAKHYHKASFDDRKVEHNSVSEYQNNRPPSIDNYPNTMANNNERLSIESGGLTGNSQT